MYFCGMGCRGLKKKAGGRKTAPTYFTKKSSTGARARKVMKAGPPRTRGGKGPKYLA